MLPSSTVGPLFGAAPETVKQAYRDLVKVWHPDRFPSDPRLQQRGRDQLKDINAAYEQIQTTWDPEKATIG
jgi:curved DNA-binding protein CbpA